jgi:hypothetical protein
MIHVPRQELLQQIQSTEPHFIRSLPYWQKPRSRSSFFGVQKRSQHDWLVVSNMAFIFHITWDVILPIDIHMFQRGWNHQPDENGSKCHSIPSEKREWHMLVLVILELSIHVVWGTPVSDIALLDVCWPMTHRERSPHL